MTDRCNNMATDGKGNKAFCDREEWHSGECNFKIMLPTVSVVSIYGKHHSKNTDRYKSQAHAIMSDSSTSIVLEWYADETRFSNEDFIGCTKEEILNLFTKKDVAYLQA